jgi:hypothetical protein
MKREEGDQSFFVGMTIGAGGAMILSIFFGSMTAVYWFAAISIIGLLYSAYLITRASQ